MKPPRLLVIVILMLSIMISQQSAYIACLQLASVILKQYVETHWCSQSEKFRPPETTDTVNFQYI